MIVSKTVYRVCSHWIFWFGRCAISEIEKMKVIASFYVSAYSSYSFLVNGLESQDKGWQIGAATLPKSASNPSVRNYTALRFRQRTREEGLRHSE